MLAGRITDAETISRRLLAAHDPAVEGAARMCLARALLAQGRHRDGLAEIEHAAQWPSLAEASVRRPGVCRIRPALDRRPGQHPARPGGIRRRPGSRRPVSCQCRYEHAGHDQRVPWPARRCAAQHRRRAAAGHRQPGRHGHQYPVQASCGYILVELDRLEEARSTLQAAGGSARSAASAGRCPLSGCSSVWSLRRRPVG